MNIFITEHEKKHHDDFVTAMNMALMFGDRLDKDKWHKKVDELFANSMLLEHERITIHKMINSNDNESFVLAKELIEIKSNNYGNTVYSG